MAAEERRNGNGNSFTADDTDLERRNDTDQLQLRLLDQDRVGIADRPLPWMLQLQKLCSCRIRGTFAVQIRAIPWQRF